MSTIEFNKYINSSEFKELLDRYETVLNSGELVYFDCDDLVDIAEAYHVWGEWDKSDEAIKYCRKLYPDDSAPLLFSARMALIDYGDINKAKAIMAELHEERESLETVYVKAEIMICEGRQDEAERYLNEKYAKYKEKLGKETADDDEEEDDEVPDFAIDVATMYCDHMNFDLALKWITKAEKPEGDYALEYYDAWSRVYMAKNMYDEAEAAINKIIDIDPFNYTAWLMMSDTQFRQARFNDALQSAEYALAIAPNDADAHMTKGNCLYALNNLEEAEKSFRRYSELCPDDAVAYLLLATTLFCNKKTQEAYEYAKKVYDNVDKLQDFQRIDALRTCATIAAKMADEGLAEKCCKKLVSLGLPEEEIDIMRGTVYLEMAEFQMAVACFEGAIKKSNYNVDILTRIGIVYYDAGALFYSYRLLKEAVETTKDDGYKSAPPRSLAFLAGACRAMGKREEYLHYLKYAVELMPLDTSCVLGDYFPLGTEPSQYYDIEKKKE